MERNPLIVITPRATAGAGDRSLPLVRTWRRAVDAGLGCVIVDSNDPEIAAAVGEAGGYAWDGGPETPGEANYRTPSGVERLAASVGRFDRFCNHDVIINLPEDRADIDIRVIRALMYPLADLGVDIATLVAPLDPAAAADEETVKVDVAWEARRRIHVMSGSQVGRARDFSRKADAFGGPPFWRHEPIYAYKRASLDRFVRREPGLRELEERLEPARALEHGMRIDVIMLVDGAGEPA